MATVNPQSINGHVIGREVARFPEEPLLMVTAARDPGADLGHGFLYWVVPPHRGRSVKLGNFGPVQPIQRMPMRRGQGAARLGTVSPDHSRGSLAAAECPRERGDRGDFSVGV